MELINILENDAFTVASMSDAIATVSIQPRELGQAGLFTAQPIRTELVGIEFKNGILQIAPIDERGSPVSSTTREPRAIRHFKTRRVMKHDRITASELSFVRQFGDNEARIVEEMQKEIASRQVGPGGLLDQCEARLELMRLGALKGLLLDQNGATVYDFYTEFGITKAPVVYLDFANNTEGALRKEIESKVTRVLRRKSRGRVFTGVGAYCGEEAWDGLMANAEFNKRYEAAAAATEAAKLSRGTLGIEVEFAGVIWKEYFGSDDGSTVSIGATEIQFHPTGGAGIFRHVLSPGETFADLGSQGQPWYSYMKPAEDFGPNNVTALDLYVATYPMMINTAPDLVIEGNSGAA